MEGLRESMARAGRKDEDEDSKRIKWGRARKERASKQASKQAKQVPSASWYWTKDDLTINVCNGSPVAPACGGREVGWSGSLPWTGQTWCPWCSCTKRSGAENYDPGCQCQREVRSQEESFLACGLFHGEPDSTRFAG
jgi:hypothetical protein